MKSSHSEFRNSTNTWCNKEGRNFLSICFSLGETKYFEHRRSVRFLYIRAVCIKSDFKLSKEWLNALACAWEVGGNTTLLLLSVS